MKIFFGDLKNGFTFVRENNENKQHLYNFCHYNFKCDCLGNRNGIDLNKQINFKKAIPKRNGFFVLYNNYEKYKHEIYHGH